MVNDARDNRGDEGTIAPRVERDEQLRSVEGDAVDACKRSEA